MPGNPLDGATGWLTISSIVLLLKYVKSSVRRLKSSLSRPTSSSFPRSGLRSGLPNEPGVTAFVPPGPNRRERAERRERVRLTARLAVRRAESERVDRAAPVPERLLVHDPRRADLRIGDPLEVVAERAVVVDAHRAGDEQAIAPAESAPAPYAPIVVLMRLRLRRRRRLVAVAETVSTPGAGEPDAAEEARVELRVVELAADRQVDAESDDVRLDLAPCRCSRR